jgi:hypothetical protein
VALVVTDLLAGSPFDQSGAERVVQQAERVELPWVTRLGRALLALRPGAAPGEGEDLREACDRDGDRWGAALVGLLQGLALPLGGNAPAAVLDDTAARFQELGAGALAALARSLAAASRARLGAIDAGPAARQAAAAARTAGVPGAEAIALLTLVAAGIPEAGEPGGRGEALAAACGLAWAPTPLTNPEDGPWAGTPGPGGPAAVPGPGGTAAPFSGLASAPPEVASSMRISFDLAFTTVATFCLPLPTVTPSKLSSTLPPRLTTSLKASSAGDSPAASATSTLRSLPAVPPSRARTR